MKKDAYCCCRCGYSTREKNNMRKHLYNLLKPCPGSRNNIELTDEIKECILNNRVYHIPKEEKPMQQINNIINYNNTMNNFINGLDFIDKINKYAEYRQVEIVDFDQSVEDLYASKVRRLENNQYKYGFSLSQQDILEIFDEVTNKKSIEDLNLIYDNKYNKFKIYVDGHWKDMLATSCIKNIVETVQSCFLNSYEIYLIRMTKNPSSFAKQKQEYLENLTEYYKFLGSFDVNPYVKGKNDNEILYNDSDPRYFDKANNHEWDKFKLVDEYTKLYDKVCLAMTKSEINNIKKQVLDVVKKNSSKNIDELNKMIFDLFCTDQEFKESIINRS
jgi:hypothetical protein